MRTKSKMETVKSIENLLKICTSWWRNNSANTGSISWILSNGGPGFLLRHKFDINQTMFLKNEIFNERNNNMTNKKAAIRFQFNSLVAVLLDVAARGWAKLRQHCIWERYHELMVRRQQCCQAPTPIVRQQCCSSTATIWRTLAQHPPWRQSSFVLMFQMQCLLVPTRLRIATQGCNLKSISIKTLKSKYSIETVKRVFTFRHQENWHKAARFPGRWASQSADCVPDSTSFEPLVLHAPQFAHRCFAC